MGAILALKRHLRNGVALGGGKDADEVRICLIRLRPVTRRPPADAAERAIQQSERTLSAAPASLDIRLFGGFELREAGAQPLRLATRKAEALLALLALQPGEPQLRDKVCALLWPDVRDTQARHSLRQTLSLLRKALPSAAAALQVDGRSLRLVATRVHVDVASFSSCIALGTRDALMEAGRHYRGELLEGMAVNEQPFERWLQCERERLRTQLSRALTQLIAMDMAAERYADAAEVCSRLLQLDPLSEEAHRSLMRLLALQGRRAAALQQYRALTQLLDEELGAAPDPLTQQLYAEIEAGTAGAAQSESSVAQPSVLVKVRAKRAPLSTIGRATELAQLLGALSTEAAAPPAEASHPCVTLVTGEAGAGKTHLCDRVVHAARARGFTVLRARCFESEQVLPLSLWANLLRSAIHPELPLSSEQRAELASLFPELGQEPHERAADARRLFHAVHRLVATLAERAPLLLLLEDLHWADEMSARLLSYVGRRQQSTRCVVLVSAREEELSATAFIREALEELKRERRLARVALSPLSHEETCELAAGLAEAHALSPLEASLLEQIWAISEGNPLVIVESVRALACGTLARDVTQLPVPERVRSLIMSRVAKVSAGSRELLSVAAVAGRELDLDVLVAIFGALPLTAAIDELAQAQLVRASDERVYFTHDRIRETLYREMLPVRRRLLHARVASALEQHVAESSHAVLGHIGYHYSRAGDAPRALRYLLRFADSAWRDHGVHEALLALEQAFADSAHLPEAERDAAAVEIAIRQAHCLASIGRFAELTTRLQALVPRVQALDAPQLIAAFHFFLGFSLAFQVERRDAEAHAQRALMLAERSEYTLVTGYAHALLAYLCQMTGRFEQGVAHGERATEQLARCDAGPEASALAWLSLALNLLWLGDPRAALRACDKASDIARSAGSLRAESLAATVAGCVYAYTDQWERALAATQHAVEASKEPATLVSALWSTAWAKSGSGQTDVAIALLSEVITALEQEGMRGWSANARMILADAQLRAGDAVRAAQLAQEAHEVAVAADELTCIGMVMRVQGQAALQLGELDKARELLDACVKLFRELHAPIDEAKSLVERAALAAEQHRPEQARQDLQRARELFVACGVDASLERIDRLEATLAEHVGGELATI